MERTDTIFDTWYNNTTKMMNDWRDMAEKHNTSQKTVWEDVTKMQQKWLSDFQSMIRNMQNPFMPGGSSGFSHNMMRDVFSNMLNSTDMYTRLFSLWQPVFNSMRDNNFRPEDFWKLIDEQEFKKFTDRLFGFDSLSPMKDFVDTSMKNMKMWFDTSTETGRQFSSMFGNSMPFFGTISQIDPQSMANWWMEMARSSARSFTPFFSNSTANTGTGDGQSVFGPGFSIMEKCNEYMSKANQMQVMMYRTAASASEKVMQRMAERAREGKTGDNFNDFYNEWSAINEQEFVALFNTDEYAALQAELIKLNSEINNAYEKQLETFLQPLPVVFRSQLEDLYKVNHELRSRLNNLEKMFNDLQESVRANAERREQKNEKTDKSGSKQ
ncbi:MAG TPA: poly(R)-hydroxyalkanoic acid synthase subunit PhaE [Flavobacterium sp.]